MKKKKLNKKVRIFTHKAKTKFGDSCDLNHKESKTRNINGA